MFDAKHARTISTAIARLAAAIHRAATSRDNSVAVHRLGDACAATIITVKDAAGRMGARHRPHAVLLVNPLATACTSVKLALAAGSDEAVRHLLDQAQAAVGLALTGAQALQNEIAPVAVRGDHMEGLDFLGASEPRFGEKLIRMFILDAEADPAKVASDVADYRESRSGDWQRIVAENPAAAIMLAKAIDDETILGTDDGSEASGDFVSNIFKTVGGLAQGAVTYAKGEKAKGDAATDAQAKLDAAIAADGTATLAVAQALMSTDLAAHDPAKADAALADKMMADSAVAAQVQAGGDVPASVRPKRVDAAQKAVTAAQAKLAAALKGTSAGAKAAAKFTVLAAQQTLAKAQGGGGAIVKSGDSPITESPTGGNVLTKKLGPLPRWAYLLMAGVGYGGYRFLKRKSA